MVFLAGEQARFGALELKVIAETDGGRALAERLAGALVPTGALFFYSGVAPAEPKRPRRVETACCGLTA